jgi:predicted HD superfamily hydrolase involved in NAD metabolism
MSDHFAELQSAGNPLTDTRRFLRRAGRVDTLHHSAQVNAAARRLARRWAWDPPAFARIDLACTAHDMASVVPLREIVRVAESLGVPLTETDRAIPQFIHGPVAAAVLRQRLGVTDEDVLNAVRHHTTLRAGASPLEQLVFIADKIALDPTARNASFHSALWAVRDTASLTELCCIYLDWAVREGPGLGWTLHPNLLDAHCEMKASLSRRHRDTE